jgi:hypothetical protein
MYIKNFYFQPTNSTFYNKNNLERNYPYNNLEQDIYSLKDEGSILLLRDFSTRTATNQSTLLSNDSNHNPLWLDEDLFLANIYKRSSKDLTENLFGIALVNIYNSQDLIIFNGVMKWPKSNKMTCIHGLGSSVVDYVIFDIPISNQIINFDLLNYHEHDSDHRHLTLTLNFFMEMSAIEIILITKGNWSLRKVNLIFY